MEIEKKIYKRSIRWRTHETIQCKCRIAGLAFLLFEASRINCNKEFWRTIMTIICADPSPISLLVLQKNVKRFLPNSSVHICRNSDSAIRISEQYGCDVLITAIDFERDKGEGILLAEKIKEMYPRVNIIFATAASEGEYTSRILKIRYSGFLNKPYTAEELRTELENLRYVAYDNIGGIPRMMIDSREC